jgi:hypothetical protein
MLTIALELAQSRPAYEDVATKFFEHYIYIANAFYSMGGEAVGLWDDQDGFFYDVLHMPDGTLTPLRVRSFVGLIPLLAVHALEPQLVDRLPAFNMHLKWFLEYRPRLVSRVASLNEPGSHGHYQLAVVGREKLVHVLRRMFDSEEFLSGYGLRSLSRFHGERPFSFVIGKQTSSVDYEPGESRSGIFGGNSNWRGPIWFPLNYLMIEALRKYHHHYGDSLKVEVPLGSGQWLTLDRAADELSRRLKSIFLRDEAQVGRRPVFGSEQVFQTDPNWHDHLLFYEYFHGDSGEGLGASHQTGWTALVANLIQRSETAGCPYCH